MHCADREDDVVVRVVERAEEPEVADRGEVEAGPVLGPAVEGDQAADDERQAGRDRDQRCVARLVRLVVARRGRAARAPTASTTATVATKTSSIARLLKRAGARTAAPESSPFGDEAAGAAVGDQVAVVGGVAARDEHDRRRSARSVRASSRGDLEPGRDRGAGRRAGRSPGGARPASASASAPSARLADDRRTRRPRAARARSPGSSDGRRR